MTKSNNPQELYDFQTKAIKTLPVTLSEIHSGNSYIYLDHTELQNTNIQYYVLNTPVYPTELHLNYAMDGTGKTQWELFIGGDRVGTTLQIIGNKNGNSTNTSSSIIYKGYSGGTTDGIKIMDYKGGVSGVLVQSISSNKSDNALVMKWNTQYILKVTSFSDDNDTNLRLTWHEHTYIENEDI